MSDGAKLFFLSFIFLSFLRAYLVVQPYDSEWPGPRKLRSGTIIFRNHATLSSCSPYIRFAFQLTQILAREWLRVRRPQAYRMVGVMWFIMLLRCSAPAVFESYVALANKLSASQCAAIRWQRASYAVSHPGRCPPVPASCLEARRGVIYIGNREILITRVHQTEIKRACVRCSGRYF